MGRFIPPREPPINILVDGVLRSVPGIIDGLARRQAAANRASRVGITLDTTAMTTPAVNFFRSCAMMTEVAVAGMNIIAWEMLRQIIGRTPVQYPPPEMVLAAASWKSDYVRTPRGTRIKFENTARDPDTGENYPLHLEFGWSDQAPVGMVRITFGEFRGQIPGLIGGAVMQEMRDAWRQSRYVAQPLVRDAITFIKSRMQTYIDVQSAFAYISAVQNEANRLHRPPPRRRGGP